MSGILERNPITRFADHGTQQGSFTLRLTEAGPAGQEFKLYIPCECYSGVAEHAGELNAGDSVLVAGKLKFTSWTAKVECPMLLALHDMRATRQRRVW